MGRGPGDVLLKSQRRTGYPSYTYQPIYQERSHTSANHKQYPGSTLEACTDGVMDGRRPRREYLGERQDIPTFTRSVPASRVAGALENFEDMVVFPSRQSRLPKFFALRAIIWGVM